MIFEAPGAADAGGTAAGPAASSAAATVKFQRNGPEIPVALSMLRNSQLTANVADLTDILPRAKAHRGHQCPMSALGRKRTR